MLALDPSSLLPFILTAIVIVLGSLFIVKKAASKYLAASFETSEGYGYRHWMSIGGGGGAGAGAACVVCGRSGPKICSRCKSVRYCSEACQTKHWATEHKLKCKPVQSSDRVASIPSVEGDLRRGKSSGSGSISLVPARGVCKVLKEPKEILFPYDEFIKLFNWDKPGFPPCGLLNFRNSCFANVVLQCLASTRPLIAYLLEKDHSRTCSRKLEDWCFLCELQAHIHRASQSRQPFSPINILSRIPKIGGNLDYGSQEDAHEFMRFAIDTMQSVCLDEFGGEKALYPSTQETTLIQHIFGGHLQSQVKCTKCNMTSNRYENMMDLTVEIHGDAESESLEDCLDQFTVKEWLDGDNKYKCDGCNGYVEAWKRLTVHQAPNILTITLKRFQSGKFGKLNKRITFPEELDLTPYMSEDGDGTDLYSLYAIVVHIDMLNASYFGHYICYTKDYYGKWYRIDDSKVTVVNVEEVLSQGAYMLLYSRKTARKEPFVKPRKPTKVQNMPVKEINSSDAPSGETVSSDLASNNDPDPSLSLLRKTEHERSMEIETSTINGKADSEVEVNLTLLREDLDGTVRHNSELNSLETETDTMKERVGLDVEVVNSTLVHKDLEDAEMNGFELNTLEIEADTMQGKEDLGVEVNSMLVQKDLEDANMNQGELSSLEMETDTADGKENFDVEANSILVHKDLDNVDINEFEDMECEAPSCVSDTNLHIESCNKNTAANRVHKMPTPSFEANMNRGELSSLEMETDTAYGKEKFDVEANSILVHKVLDDVDVNEVEDMECAAPSCISDTNLHIESSSKNTITNGVHNMATPSFEAYISSSSNEQECSNTSELNQDALGSSNGVVKQLDHEISTETENPNFAASTMANGYINGQLELVNKVDAPPDSNIASVNSNLLNPIKLESGPEAVCSSENCRCNGKSTFVDGRNCGSKLINGACS